MTWKVIHGDMLDVLRGLDDNSIDSCVTDPPYGIGFMSKSWDHGVPGKEYWEQVLRVLRPGGHLLAFGGSRMFHRMFCAIEDAGFEIRDTLMWVYGSGFPKSLDVSKALDKAAGAEREIVGSMADICARYKTPRGKPIHEGGLKSEVAPPITAPATDLAKQWNGWGTALKPAHEPICMARKPLEGPVAFNIAKWGVGGLNIDGCRIGTAADMNPADFDDSRRKSPKFNGRTLRPPENPYEGRTRTGQVPDGRWPANLLHDGSDEVVGLFPTSTSGVGGQPQSSSRSNLAGLRGLNADGVKVGHGDSGSAARFFYCAKASKKDRNEGLHAGGCSHPTVKPTELMRYLTRLVTPPGGLVLDPFTGSGSTGKAAVLEGFSFIGVEREAEYVAIAEARIAAAVEPE